MSLDTGSNWGKHLQSEKARSLGETSLRNYVAQATIARYAYEHRPDDEKKEEPPPEKITGNDIMLWWGKKGFNAAYGDYADSHPEEVIDLRKEEQLADFVEKIRGRQATIH